MNWDCKIKKSPGRPRGLIREIDKKQIRENDSRDKDALRAIGLRPGSASREIMDYCGWDLSSWRPIMRRLDNKELILSKTQGRGYASRWYLTKLGETVLGAAIEKAVWLPTKEGMEFREGPIYMECSS